MQCLVRQFNARVPKAAQIFLHDPYQINKTFSIVELYFSLDDSWSIISSNSIDLNNLFVFTSSMSSKFAQWLVILFTLHLLQSVR